MKTILMVRHAETENGFNATTDFERKLLVKGQHDASTLAKTLIDKNIVIDLIVSSSAIRAKQTASIIAENMDYELAKIYFANDLYNASARQIEQTISALSNAINTVMIVCHNPGITEFVNTISDDIIMNMPTCSIVAIEVDTDDWAMVMNASSKQLFFEFPTKTF